MSSLTTEKVKKFSGLLGTDAKKITWKRAIDFYKNFIVTPTNDETHPRDIDLGVMPSYEFHSALGLIATRDEMIESMFHRDQLQQKKDGLHAI